MSWSVQTLYVTHHYILAEVWIMLTLQTLTVAHHYILAEV